MRLRSAWPLLLLGWSAVALAAEPSRSPGPVRIDGRLDEPAWQAAPAITSFTQKLPREGEPPRDPTTVRVLYDDDAVYIGVDCVQSVPVTARLTRRDHAVEADRVVIELDTTHDRRSAFHFEINAAGVLADGLHYADTEASFEWDEVWDGRVARRADGWSAELRIPLRILRLGGDASQSWGFEVRRFVAATQEVDELFLIRLDDGGEVSRYGDLGPFVGLERPLGLELRPFAVGQLLREDALPDSERRGWSASGSLGLDARWRLGPSFTFDLALDPDFGQVEADDVVLNLTSYETFFEERRPFFTSGLDLFATPLTLVYTRRIGALPEAPGGRLTAPLTPVRIDAAGKLTGRAGPLSIAVLAALTDDRFVQVVDGPRLRVAPYTVFAAGRFKLDLGHQASVAVSGTSTTRLGDERDSQVASADLAWRSAGGDWSVQAQAAASHVGEGQDRQLADGTVIGRGDTGGAALLVVNKEGGAFVLESNCELYGRRFDAGDLGFVRRQNLAHCFAAAGWHDTRKGRLFVDQRHQLELFLHQNLDGQHLGSGVQVNSRGELPSGASFFTELHWRPAYLDDRELGDGSALERAGLVGLELELVGDPRWPLVPELSLTAQWLDNGVNLELALPLGFQLHPQLELSLAPTVLYTRGEPRFVGDSAGGDRLFADEEALGLGAVLRVGFTFTTTLSLQVHAQVFFDRLRFSDFASAPAADREIHLHELASAPRPAESLDLADGTFNASLVLRWEWAPGSTLFVVYSRAQSTAAPGSLPARATLTAPAVDALSVKLAWWLG